MKFHSKTSLPGRVLVSSLAKLERHISPVDFSRIWINRMTFKTLSHGRELVILQRRLMALVSSRTWSKMTFKTLSPGRELVILLRRLMALVSSRTWSKISSKTSSPGRVLVSSLRRHMVLDSSRTWSKMSSKTSLPGRELVSLPVKLERPTSPVVSSKIWNKMSFKTSSELIPLRKLSLTLQLSSRMLAVSSML